MSRTQPMAVPALPLAWPARVREWVRRPEGIGEATRWLFVFLVLASVLLAIPAPFSAANGTVRLMGVASAVVLGLSACVGYRRRSAPLAMDLVDSVALLAFALASPEPTAVFPVVFSLLWFRSLYGSGRRAVLRCALYAGAIGASLPFWLHVPGHTGAVVIGSLVGVFPTMFLTVVVGRHLASSVQAREQAARVDAVQMSLGGKLLGVTQAEEIRRIAWAAYGDICAAIPGLRVMKVVRDGATSRLDAAAGPFAHVPAVLAGPVLTLSGVDGGTASVTAQGHSELNEAVGSVCAWTALSVPASHEEYGRAWLVIGCPRRVPAEAVLAVESLANLVTLALRHSEVHQVLSEKATLDSLTGLANRASFNGAVSAAVDTAGAGETTVLFVDLDDFKDVNDVFGHSVGDSLLRKVAERLREATRPQDLCARLGGDEFAVLLRDTGAEAATRVAERIVEWVGTPMKVSGGYAYLGASVGIASAQGVIDLERLIHSADVAMYAAKANGKGRVQVFEAGLLRADPDQVWFERQLSEAAGNGELVVRYQPVLSLPELRCTAVEALVRWQHPERGLLYPADFIEIAERTGAIRGIGAYVLRRACADAVTWRDAHPSVPLAIHVNISALQLDDEQLIGTVLDCLRDFNLPADQLVLEVTETVIVSSPAAITQLNALAAHGIVIAIAGFGTGYSALTTLRSLPVQIVKIDRSFVIGSAQNPEDLAVTEAVISRAAKMGLQTIAEGVETRDQQRLLARLGADSVQGYLYLRPTTAENFGTWLSGNLAERRTSELVTATATATATATIPFRTLPSA